MQLQLMKVRRAKSLRLGRPGRHSAFKGYPAFGVSATLLTSDCFVFDSFVDIPDSIPRELSAHCGMTTFRISCTALVYIL